MIVVKRSTDLILHLATGFGGMLIFLAFAAQHLTILGFIIWCGMMISYHFVIRFFFFTILYSRGKMRGLYRPLKGHWVRIDARPPEDLK